MLAKIVKGLFLKSSALTNVFGPYKILYLCKLEFVDFSQYLKGKKIDEKLFRQEEPDRFEEFKKLFDQVHPDSFTAQKLFLINKIRRRYLLKEEAKEESTMRKAVKPKIKPSFKK